MNTTKYTSANNAKKQLCKTQKVTLLVSPLKTLGQGKGWAYFTVPRPTRAGNQQQQVQHIQL